MKLMDIFEGTLQEGSMSPKDLRAFAATADAQKILVGFETEMLVPTYDEWEETEPQPDFSHDTQAHSIDEIVNFFRHGDFGIGRMGADLLRRDLNNDYQEWVDDQIKNRMEDVGDDQIIKLAARDGLDQDQINDLFVDRDSQFERYYSQVLDQVNDEINENVEFYDYARDTHMTMMTDVASTYNLDWPIWSEGSSTNTNIIQKIADDIERALEVTIAVSTNYHTAPRMGGVWVLEPDSSIEPDETSEYIGLELITPSPPFPLPKALEWIDHVFSWARDYGCKTNNSTGFHISMSIPGVSPSDIDWIKLVLMLGDQYVLDSFGRSANTYAQSAMDMLIKHMIINDKFNSASAIDIMRQGLMNLASQDLGRPSTGKYVSVNFKDKYIEFRSAGGDYLENQQQIKNTMIRYARAVSLAADPQAEKKEYASKLYKLLTKNSQTSRLDHVMELFSMYQAGTITKQVLVNSLKSLRLVVNQQKDL